MDKKNIGETIRTARQLLHMTQKELEEKIGVGHTSIVFWEKGVYVPSGKYIIELNKILGINLLDETVVSPNSNILEDEIKLELRIERRIEEKLDKKIEQKINNLLMMLQLKQST